MADLTQDEVRTILARAAAATPGPWQSFIEGRDHTCGSTFIRTGGEDIEMSGATDADHDFIANARQDIPRLVAELAKAKGWRLDV